MENLLSGNFGEFYRILIAIIFVYFLILFVLNFSGERIFEKIYTFHVALSIIAGTVFGSLFLNNNITGEIVFPGIAVFIFLQFCTTFISLGSKNFKNFVSDHPKLLFYRGEILYNSLENEKITISTLYKSIEEAGLSGFCSVESIKLESNGDITVISEDPKDKYACTIMEDLTA